MKKPSDALMGILLMVMSWGYLTLSQAQNVPKEAVLADISVILSDLEAELKKVESSREIIVSNVNMHKLFSEAKNTAIIGKSEDAPLIPDITGKGKNLRLGGCPVDDAQWTVVRLDYSALTEIPDVWTTPNLKICLDRNGPRGPNQDGFDVIWLQISRNGSPHITLIPSAKGQLSN